MSDGTQLDDYRERLRMQRMAATRKAVGQWGACVALGDAISTLHMRGDAHAIRSDAMSVHKVTYPDFNLGNYLELIANLISTLAAQVTDCDKAAAQQKAAADHNAEELQKVITTQAGYMKSYQEYIAFLESEAIMRGATPAQLAEDFKAMQGRAAAEAAPAAGAPADSTPPLPRAKLVPNDRPAMGPHDGDLPSTPEATHTGPDDFGGEEYFGRLR